MSVRLYAKKVKDGWYIEITERFSLPSKKSVLNYCKENKFKVYRGESALHKEGVFAVKGDVK